MKQHFAENIQQNKNLYMFNGVMFMILGVIALMSPFFAAQFLDLLIGCLLLITGLFQGVVSYAARRHWTYYLSAVIYVIAGLYLIVFPSAGVLFLAAIIGVFMFLQGSMQIFYAGVFAPFRGWRWMLGSGILNIALALIIFIGWPITAIWFIGIVVGVNLISFGLSLLMLARYVSI